MEADHMSNESGPSNLELLSALLAATYLHPVIIYNLPK